MTELISVALGLITVGGSAFFGWFFSRRRTKAEARSVEIDNDVKLSSHYQLIIDDLEKRYQEKIKELEELYNRKIDLLKQEIALLRNEIKELEQEKNNLLNQNNKK